MKVTTGILLIILIFTATITILFYFNIFNIQDLLNDSCSFGREAKCGEYSLARDALTIDLVSSLPETVALASVAVPEIENCKAELDGKTWAKGSQVKATIPCDFSAFTPDTKNRLQLEIEYYLPKSGPNFPKKISGKLFTTYHNVSLLES